MGDERRSGKEADVNAALSRWENEGGAISDEDAREQQADAAGDGSPDSEPGDVQYGSAP